MLVVFHNGDEVEEVFNTISTSTIIFKKDIIVTSIFDLAKDYPDTILVWCHIQLKEYLNIAEIEDLFHHKKLLYSYNPTEEHNFDQRIGYVDTSPFLKINKSVTFPTWQMSAWVGGIHSEVILALQNEMPIDKDFDYFLTSLAKLGMPQGLLCYSEPRLLKEKTVLFLSKNKSNRLFRFVKQHYKIQWLFLLFFNLLIYERKFPLAALLSSLFYNNRGKLNINLEAITVQSTKKVVRNKSIDVIIPTIGRKSYLYDVLKDFSKQTLLPIKIVIVEQNPLEGSQSELDYLQEEKWPFEILHFFIHQSGACNARNLALEMTSSEWVFLADDDNRFESSLLSDIFDAIEKYGSEVVTTAYPQEKEIKNYRKVIQWPTFGAGNSFVKRTVLDNVKFNRALEFGYGEDGDFGMQLRNKGQDVLFLPEPSILHLKAPIGGFRTKPVLGWQNEKIQPKPSPTVMLYQILHNTKEQRLGYKIILFFKYYRLQKIKNPLKYYFNFQKEWKSSIFWANQLKSKNEV
jgi:glycosyltransferase involved in cell wall biosynthesis